MSAAATATQYDPGVLFLLGPTAAGKTELAIALADALDAEIVSVDSALVYRGLDIGTAKPDAATLARVSHALVDIRDPAEPYSVADFCRDAHAEIARIHAAGRTALLTGGTSLYFRALEHGLSAMPARDDAVRARLTREAALHGWDTLHRRLATIDATSAGRIHPNDAQRIQRALEIHALSGRPPSALRAGPHAETNAARWSGRICKLVVAPASRALLHERIEARFHLMLAQGFVAEVEKLHARPDLTLQLPALRAAGYRQLWRVLDRECSLDEGADRAIVATRQLAKRQLTWLRSLAGARWLDSDDPALWTHAVAVAGSALAGCRRPVRS